MSENIVLAAETPTSMTISRPSPQALSSAKYGTFRAIWTCLQKNIQSSLTRTYYVMHTSLPVCLVTCRSCRQMLNGVLPL